jgi:hypothetical protein
VLPGVGQAVPSPKISPTSRRCAREIARATMKMALSWNRHREMCLQDSRGSSLPTGAFRAAAEETEARGAKPVAKKCAASALSVRLAVAYSRLNEILSEVTARLRVYCSTPSPSHASRGMAPPNRTKEEPPPAVFSNYRGRRSRACCALLRPLLESRLHGTVAAEDRKLSTALCSGVFVCRFIAHGVMCGILGRAI